MSLQGSVTLVTGGAKGLGQAISFALAEAGADVAVFDVGDPSATAEGIRARGRRALALQVDVRQSEQVAAGVRRVATELGHPDLLVNNAGVYRSDPVVELSEADWDLVLATNLTGTFLCCRAVLPGMIERRSGAIIGISSRAGVQGGAYRTAYSATKAGLNVFAYGLAREVEGHGIRVYTVLPDGIDTDMSRAFLGRGLAKGWFTPQWVEEFRAGQRPLERVAELVVLLAGEGSLAVSGRVFAGRDYAERGKAILESTEP